VIADCNCGLKKCRHEAPVGSLDSASRFSAFFFCGGILEVFMFHRPLQERAEIPAEAFYVAPPSVSLLSQPCSWQSSWRASDQSAARGRKYHLGSLLTRNCGSTRRKVLLLLFLLDFAPAM